MKKESITLPCLVACLLMLFQLVLLAALGGGMATRFETVHQVFGGNSVTPFTKFFFAWRGLWWLGLIACAGLAAYATQQRSRPLYWRSALLSLALLGTILYGMYSTMYRLGSIV